MRRVLCSLLFLLAVAVPTVFAEEVDERDSNRYRYSILGDVVDENGQPMPGATVRVLGTTFGAGTDSDGEFVIRLENAKEYTLLVSFIGYESQEIKAVPAVRPPRLHIRLVPSSNQLNDVVVTGSFVAKPLKEVPVLTRVISQKEIQALNPMNVETLLQYELPGLQIGYNSMSQMPEISYQGMDGEYMLFLIDGERVSGEGADHNVDFTRFNVDDIERIEVIKGAQSTIYGSNALGGVINIITKTANRPFSGNLNARYAGSNGQKYTASTGVKKNRLTSYTSLTYRTKDTYEIGDEVGKTTVTEGSDGSSAEEQEDAGSTTVYGYNIWDFLQKIGYTCNEKLNADLKGSFYRNKRDKRVGKMYQDIFLDYTLNGKVTYLPGEKQQLVIGYIYDNYQKNQDYFLSGKKTTDYRNIKQTPRIDYTGTFGKHTVSVGFEGDFEYLKHYMLEDSSHVDNQLYAFYAQEDWDILDELNIVAGVRADYHEKYHWHVTPKVSLLWHFCDHVSFRAGYAQGFRSPSLKELYQAYDMGGMGWFMLYGNPDLKPETSNQISLSGEFTKGGLNMSVSFAHNRFRNKIAYMSLGDGSSDMQYVNADNAKTTALETILRYRFGFGLILTGSYAYTNDYEEVDGRNTSLVRPHTATFNAMYSHKFGKIGFNCSLNGQWGAKFDTYTRNQNDDGTYAYEITTYDARTMCSLNTGVTLPKGISLNLGIDNLFNYKDKAADSSLQIPQKGISVIGTVNLNIADMFGL